MKVKNEYREVPISAAKEVSKQFDKEEVIVLAVDRKFNKVHITTYGSNRLNCKNAAITGDFLAEILQISDENKFSEIIEKIKKEYLTKRNENYKRMV